MAQESLQENLESSIESDDRIAVADDRSSPSEPVAAATASAPSLGRSVSFSRLNARAPEFVPRVTNRVDLPQQQPPPRIAIPQPPIPVVHVYPSPNSPFHAPPMQSHGSVQYYGGFGDGDGAQAPPHLEPAPVRDSLSEEVTQKVVNQVEYYFSDVNLATTDHLRRFINKDPEGFVPISVVAAFKKIKALVSSNPLLAKALRTSSKLVVSEDGKKVRRQHPFTDADVEELQSRIVVAENLPEDHSYQNLMKVFSVVGSVKAIRTCPPQTTNGAVPGASRSGKMDMPFSNKLHAFVEYETVELAEKAVAELNNERNWRSGLKVRLLLRRTTKPARGRKMGHESDWNGEEEDVSTSEQPNEKQPEDPQPSESSHEHAVEEGLNGHNDKEGGARRAGRARGRGKGRGRGQHHNNRGGHAVGTPPSNNSIQNDQPAVSKQPPGPRMPDGTRGFTLGRGKPLGVTTA
ncbi:la-related protein 6B isoform X2 [Magnolia sinica]|uniref:la-related protein 6B isoform X2 n=1 Tax=Magnolia sinica TaxID=86752 RepID=UPI0026598809|nr:la-related protein 6B isoform X2 [Magnolia sinica]